MTTADCLSEPVVRPAFPAQGHLVNLGCGACFHEKWLNFDLRPRQAAVRRHDVRTKLPLAEGTCAAVYHAHLLEHLSRGEAQTLLGECWRVLAVGGVLRVVVPDLEKIARLYLEALEEAERGDAEAIKRHEWMTLEMYDQAVRERAGGEMLEYLERHPRHEFAWGRLGADGGAIRAYLVARECEGGATPALTEGSRLNGLVRRIREWLLRRLLGPEMTILEAGRFRSQGEVHRWMYDRVALGRLMKECGFAGVRRVEAAESRIPDWPSYGLDVDVAGHQAKPDSLYMEGVKA